MTFPYAYPNPPLPGHAGALADLDHAYRDILSLQARGPSVTDFASFDDGLASGPGHDDLPYIMEGIGNLSVGQQLWLPRPPSGSYHTLSGPIVVELGVKLKAASPFGTMIQGHAAGPVVQVGGGGDVSGFDVEGLRLHAASGAQEVIKQVDTVALSRFDRAWLSSNNGGYALWSNNGHEIFNVCWQDVIGQMQSTATVPGFDIKGNTTIDSLEWNRGRYNGASGAPIIRVENQSGGASWAYDLSVIGACFEIPRGGCVHALSAAGVYVTRCGVYDMPSGTPSTDDLVHVGKSAVTSSQPSKGIKVDGFRRRGSYLGAGKYDVNIDTGTTGISLALIGAEGGSSVAVSTPTNTYIGEQNSAVGNTDTATTGFRHVMVPN